MNSQKKHLLFECWDGPQTRVQMGNNVRTWGLKGPTGKYVRVPARTSQKAAERVVWPPGTRPRWVMLLAGGERSLKHRTKSSKQGETNGDTEASPGKPGTPEGNAS